jgi:hypothetical protein
MKRPNCCILLLIALMAPAPCLAASCHAVGPSATGSGSGGDWNDMMNKLPSTLTRGDTYYLADGSYGSYTFNTSGTTATIIKKATASDYGAGCSPSIAAGWNASMGSTQAVFTQWSEGSNSGGNYSLNGVVGTFNVNNGLPTQGSFGILLNGSACHSGSLGRCVELDGGESQNFQNVTFSYIEIQGTGATSNANTNTPDDMVYYGGSNGLTLDHMYMHDSSCDFTFGYGSANLMVQHSYIYKNYGAGSCHGQVSWNGSTNTNPTWRYNTFRTIEGTAVITAATAGGGTTLSGLTMYGNVFYFGGLGDKSDYQCLGNGLISCVNSGVACSGVKFYNNTVVGFPANNSGGGPSSCGASGAAFYDDGSATWNGLIVENNLWYGNNTSSTPDSHITGIVENYNSYLSNPGGIGTGAQDVNNGSAANPFVLWTGSGNLNAQLTAESPNLNNWVTLGSPFNIDPLGMTRSTDRGSYQYGGAAAGPFPPSGLVASVQ